MYSCEKTPIDGLLVLTPREFPDERGTFFEAFNKNALKEWGIDFEICQENHIINLKKGVFRGLHFQNLPFAQAKLVRCIKGSVWDVAVDLRKESKTHLQWFAVTLTEQNKKQFFLPKGFAHGVLSLEDDTHVTYATDDFWNKEADRTIKYNDPSINLHYPTDCFILSDKDKNAPPLIESDCNL